MGYKMPIVCKRVILPVPINDGEQSLESYREKYGIDLKKLIVLNNDDKKIGFLFKKGVHYLLATSIDYESSPAVGEINYMNSIAWVSGSNTGLANIMYVVRDSDNDNIGGFGLNFSIDKDDDFVIDNVKVNFSEI